MLPQNSRSAVSSSGSWSLPTISLLPYHWPPSSILDNLTMISVDTRTFLNICLLIVKGALSTGSLSKAWAKLRATKLIWSSSSNRALKDSDSKKIYFWYIFFLLQGFNGNWIVAKFSSILENILLCSLHEQQIQITSI